MQACPPPRREPGLSPDLDSVLFPQAPADNPVQPAKPAAEAPMATSTLPLSTTVLKPANAIKNLIISQGLKPGDPLPAESELCTKLGISRSSVREALRRLQALDIVVVRRGVGSFVGNLSTSSLIETLAFKAVLRSSDDLEALREIVQVRRYLDLGVAETVCERLRGTQQPNLETLVNQMEDMAASGQIFTDQDYAFHDGLLSVARNEVMRQLVSSLWQVHYTAFSSLPQPSVQSLLITAQAHRQMLDAATSGNVAAYVDAVSLHYAPVELTLDTTARL